MSRQNFSVARVETRTRDSIGNLMYLRQIAETGRRNRLAARTPGVLE